MSGCPDCGERKLVISCVDRGGWLIKCNKGHELFPFPGMTIVTYDPEITPTQLTYRNK